MIIHSFIPFPAEFVAFANGLVYGPIWGAVITWVGAMLGAFVAFGLARWLGRPFVETFVPNRRRARVDRWAARSGWQAVFVSRFLPVISFNLVNYAAGLTTVSLLAFTLATGLGILPVTIVMVMLGHNMYTASWETWGVLALGGFVVWAVLHWASRRHRRAQREERRDMTKTDPQAVLDFWFSDRDDAGEAVFRRAWFDKDDAFDAAIRDRFGATYDQAVARRLEDWRAQPKAALALVVTLDQFSCNMFRDDPKMYAADGYAAEVAKGALAKGFDKDFGILEGWFFYMPLMHSEALADQDAYVALFEKLPQNETVQRGLESARQHREIVPRFGRFPHRNKILGRPSTPEEEAFLLEPNSSF